MTQGDHEYMDTGALTEDAVPEQPPFEAPGSEAEQAQPLAQPEDIQPESVEGGATAPTNSVPVGVEVGEPGEGLTQQ